MVSFDQKPESTRSVMSLIAPARRQRATSSSTKRLVPLAVLADPLRMRACSTSPVSGPRRQERVVTEDLGVAVGGQEVFYADTRAASALFNRWIQAKRTALQRWSSLPTRDEARAVNHGIVCKSSSSAD
jgi:hypothetical protein